MHATRTLGQATDATERIRRLMKGHTDRKAEAEILALLAEQSAPDLNYVLEHLDLEALFNDVDDHLWGPQNKTRLLEMLGRERLDDLDSPARAAIIDGLQRGWTALTEEERRQRVECGGGIEERAIRDVFVGTSGHQLTEVKNLVNAGADHYDMHNLLGHDVDDPNLVNEMLDHFAASAPRGEIKPLSDIDDTFYANWKDQRFPSKTVYPGVLAFYQELDRGPDEGHPQPLGDLTFLTARPEDPWGIVKDRAHRDLRQRGIPQAAVLAGSVTTLADNEKIARKKFENFEEYARIYPEYDFAWIGDSGQGDAMLAERLLSSHPNRVKGAFIHDVVGLDDQARQQLRQRGVRVFDTYVGAAVEAHQAGLISAEGVRRVAAAAQQDFWRVEFRDDQQRQARLDELQADLVRAGR